MTKVLKLWKVWQNIDILLVTTEGRRNSLVSEPNYHTKKVFHRKFVGYRNENSYINKPVYIALSILEGSKILIYEFW